MKISVALCTYNGKSFLREQIDSILRQTICVDEIIICDDGSIDGTLEVLYSYVNLYPNLVHVFVNNKSLGTIRNFEKAISLTKGDLIFLADQDDVWYSTKVEKIERYFQSNKKCQLVFTNGDLMNEKGKKLNHTLWEKWDFDFERRNLWKNNEFAFRDLIVGNNKITGATVCFSKTLKNKIFPFELPLGYWHDNLLGIHSAASEGLFFIEESLIGYRIHSNQQVGISSNVLEKTTLNANRKNISTEKYFNIFRNKYPHLREYIPSKKRNFLKMCLFKFTKKLNHYYTKCQEK